MKTDNAAKLRSDRVWLQADDCQVGDLQELTSRKTSLADYPFADSVLSNVLIYDCSVVREVIGNDAQRKAVMAEWAATLPDAGRKKF